MTLAVPTIAILDAGTIAVTLVLSTNVVVRVAALPLNHTALHKIGSIYPKGKLRSAGCGTGR